MNAVESIWTAARNRAGEFRDRRAPSPGIAAVLVALLHARQAHVSRLAELSEQNQGNLSRAWLPKLRAWGFAELVEEVPGCGNQGGGRPAQYWSLTPAGRRLAQAVASS